MRICFSSFSRMLSLNDSHWGKNQDKKPSENSEIEQDERAKEVKKPLNSPKPSSGPPDLEEVWGDFTRHLERLFKGKKNKGGFSNGSNSSSPGKPRFSFSGKNSSAIVIGLLILALLIWLCTGFFIVQEGQSGIVLRFGKFQYATTSGIQWHLPYPVQTHEIVNMSQIRSVEVGRAITIRSANLKDASMLTSDENIIDIRFAVQYRIKDAEQFLFTNVDAEQSVTLAAETAVREIVGRSKMDYVLYAGREAMANDLVSLIQRILDNYQTGIFITSITVQSVQPPEQVQAAFDDAVKASQDRERQKNEAQAYANNVIPRARGGAARLIEEARAYTARVVAYAEGDSQRFNQIQTVYAQSPQTIRDKMYLGAMNEIFERVTKILIDTQNNNSLFYLPLDKIIHDKNLDELASPASLDTKKAVSSPMQTQPTNTFNHPETPANLLQRDRNLR